MTQAQNGPFKEEVLEDPEQQRQQKIDEIVQKVKKVHEHRLAQNQELTQQLQQQRQQPIQQQRARNLPTIQKKTKQMAELDTLTKATEDLQRTLENNIKNFEQNHDTQSKKNINWTLPLLNESISEKHNKQENCQNPYLQQ